MAAEPARRMTATRRGRTGLRTGAGLLLALAVPGIACLCDYASDDLGETRAGWAPLVRLAWPAMLLAGVGVVAALASRRRHPRAVGAGVAVFVASGALLLVARAH